jgi:hypothetical protein
VSLRNDGVGDVTVTGLLLSGASAFTIAGSSPAGCGTLAPFATCHVAVRFAPEAAGAQSATLTITSTAAPVVVTVNATGRAPALVVLSGNPMTISATQVGEVRTGTVSLRNEGVGEVAVSGYSLGGDAAFSLAGSSPAGCGTLAPFATCNIAVRFAPTAPGAQHATLAIASTAGPLAVAITATGLAPSLVVTSANPLVLPATPAGSTRTGAIQIRNTGAGEVVVRAVSLSGDTEFTLAGTSPAGCGALAPFQYCTITVQFAPMAPGTRTTTVAVTSDAPRVDVVVTGTGT